ncbi:MAG: acyloxyacyl hydrolase [Alphaproteobacteria bacterium]|nr:acyloxyacyl hydrolase [Alphaproteobacteria bacterium]
MAQTSPRLLGRLAALACLITGLATAPAAAQNAEWEDWARQYGVSELRAGLFLDDLEQAYPFPFLVLPETIDLGKWQNLTGEVLFSLPDVDMVRWLGSPRIGLGGSLNFTGKISYARLAAVWHIPIFETGIFIEPMVGGMVHNGYLTNAPPGKRNMGCTAIYFYGGNIGYDINDKLNIMATFEHGSHYGQCGTTTNDGVNRMGLRVGWKLD